MLKLLPVIKTVINFRQQLLAPSKPSLEAVKKEGDALSLEEKVQNAGSDSSKLSVCVYHLVFFLQPALLEGPTLLILCLAVMRRYQFLSPSLFTQADFSPAKLLPSLSQLRAGGRGCLGDPAVLLATLNLLGEAPSDYLQWRQQVRGGGEVVPVCVCVGGGRERRRVW